MSEQLPVGKVLVPSHRSGGKRKFHTDPECQYVTEDHTEWDRETAESWGFDKCVKCDGVYAIGGYNARDE